MIEFYYCIAITTYLTPHVQKLDHFEEIPTSQWSENWNEVKWNDEKTKTMAIVINEIK